jgi:hypothetical protein
MVRVLVPGHLSPSLPKGLTLERRDQRSLFLRVLLEVLPNPRLLGPFYKSPLHGHSK